MKRDLQQLVLATLLLAAAATPVRAALYGTMSNFDVFNDTPQNAYGAELELEGVHSADVINTYPSHFDHRTVTEYNNGLTFGTRIAFSGYNFGPIGYLAPTVGQSTNGHACVDTAGCEHFGFAVTAQPTQSRYFWTDDAGQRISDWPMSVPTPSWNYVVPAGGRDPELHAEVELPENEHAVQQPDALWMRVFKTQLNRPVKLKELMSGNGLVPEDFSETETEWELLERGMIADAKDRIRDADQKAIIRRYEFFKYTGPYDSEHEPATAFDGKVITEPPVGELGNFISANMVAANLAPQVIVEGDYNDDGIVDGADYVIWRRHRGSEVEVEVDADHSGRVDDGDLVVWRMHYGGIQAGIGLASGSAVPEPASAALLLVGAGVALRRRSRRDG
jgi:hypothetical protein